MPENYILTVKQDILNERPSIVIVGQDAEYSGNNGIDLEGTTMHAMTVIGTTTAMIDTGDNVDYLRVIDPWDGISKYVAWDPYNWEARDYFAIYAIVRINITK